MVLIEGSVTDQSPGAKGTPVISDNDMTAWMQYLYKQQAMPTNAKGATVQLTAFDPNGNIENIGTAVSDTNGNYGISWTPPVPGTYKIIATFSGSNSYYSSDATTYLAVGKAAASPQASGTPAPTATTPSTVTPTPSPQVTTTPVPPPSSPGMPTTYIVIAVVAIIVVVAAAALALRRRK